MTFDDLLPFIWPNCLACPRDTVIHHARQAAIEFFESTLVWEVDLDTLLADGYSSDYALPLDDQCEVAKLLEVNVKSGADARPVEAELVSARPGRKALRHGTIGLRAWTEDRRTLRLSSAPSADTEIDVVAALKPSQTAYSMPDEVLAHNAEAIAQGALERIFLMSRVDWRDTGAAADARARFNSAIKAVGHQAERGFARQVRDKSERFF